MPAPGSTSPIRAAAFDKLQLNAGVFIEGLNYATIANAGALKTAVASAITSGTTILGVTRGGGTFTVQKNMRTPEVDGMRYPFVGADFVDSIEAYLSGTLLEVTPDNFKRLFGSATKTIDSLKTTITMQTNPTAADYISSLCWVGDLADGSLVVINLKNAINTADFSFTFTDKGEGTLTFEFHARQAAVTDFDNAPFEVVFFAPAS